ITQNQEKQEPAKGEWKRANPCSLLRCVPLCHPGIAWLPTHPPLTAIDRSPLLYRRGIKSLSNLVIQLREVCNHPDLLESAFDGSWLYPPVNEIVEQCENFRLLEWLLKSYLQAEADCTKAINLDKKVSYFSLHNTAWKIRSCK
ncbi:hypothetical protein S245_063800, partial [Arachis hypogaea]